MLLRPDPAPAQTYPNRPIKVIVPFPAGHHRRHGRIMSDRLGTELGQSSSSTTAAAAPAAASAPNWSRAPTPTATPLMTPGDDDDGAGGIQEPGLRSSQGFQAGRMLIATPQVLTFNQDLPVKTLADLAAYAKANPGKLSLGSQGFGTGTHLLADCSNSKPGSSSCTCLIGARRRCSPSCWPVKFKCSRPARPCYRKSRPGRSAELAVTRRARTSNIAGRSNHRRSGLPKNPCAVLARCCGAGGDPGGYHQQAQRGISRKPGRTAHARAGSRHA